MTNLDMMDKMGVLVENEVDQGVNAGFAWETSLDRG
jgi:hypothetical protein